MTSDFGGRGGSEVGLDAIGRSEGGVFKFGRPLDASNGRLGRQMGEGGYFLKMDVDFGLP